MPKRIINSEQPIAKNNTFEGKWNIFDLLEIHLTITFLVKQNNMTQRLALRKRIFSRRNALRQQNIMSHYLLFSSFAFFFLAIAKQIKG